MATSRQKKVMLMGVAFLIAGSLGTALVLPKGSISAYAAASLVSATGSLLILSGAYLLLWQSEPELPPQPAWLRYSFCGCLLVVATGMLLLFVVVLAGDSWEPGPRLASWALACRIVGGIAGAFLVVVPVLRPNP